MVESIPLDKRPPAATCTFQATWHLRRSLLECPLLKCHRTTGCWAVTHAGLPNQVVYANWVCLSSAVKGPGSALLHKQNSCTWECQLPPACPSGRPAFDGQIGINLGKMGASVEVTLCHYTSKSERERCLWHGEQEQWAGLIVPPLPRTPFCISCKRRWWKQVAVSGRKQTPRKWAFFPPFSPYPSAGPHNSEEPSCGNVIVWWRWSKQCDRML